MCFMKKSNASSVGAILLALLLGAATSVLAQAPWPSKVVRIVVPFAPGALTDVAARSLAVEMSEQLGQQFVVENKGGAGGTLGAADGPQSPPHGPTPGVPQHS